MRGIILERAKKEKNWRVGECFGRHDFCLLSLQNALENKLEMFFITLISHWYEFGCQDKRRSNSSLVEICRFQSYLNIFCLLLELPLKHWTVLTNIFQSKVLSLTAMRSQKGKIIDVKFVTVKNYYNLSFLVEATEKWKLRMVNERNFMDRWTTLTTFK